MPDRKLGCSYWKCQLGAGVSSSCPLPPWWQGSEHKQHCKQSSPPFVSWGWEVYPALIHGRCFSGLLLLVKKKDLKRFLHFLHKAEPSHRKSPETVNHNTQLKNCFHGYYQETIGRNVVWIWWKQDALFACVALLGPFKQYFLQRSWAGRKEELFVNIWYSQTWAL